MRTGLLLFLSGWAWAQLSGIVNSYAAVTAFVDPATVTVDDPSPFNVGDRVLLYQAKGATISTNNDPTYSDIISIGSAGVFEFHQIAAINGNNTNSGQRVSECRRVELCVAVAPTSGGHAHLLFTLRRPLT